MKIVNMHLYDYNAKFKTPVITPKVKMNTRKAIFVELITDKGKSYFGESNAFETNWYANETIEDVKHFSKLWFQQVQGKTFHSFLEIQDALTQLSNYPATRSMLVMACYQMFHVLESLNVPYGATVNGMTSRNFQQLVQTQPQRVKLKWNADILDDVEKVSQLAFRPDIAIDANESLSKVDYDKLKTLSEAQILYIEEPFKSLQHLTHFEKNELPPVAIDEKATSKSLISQAINDFGIDVVVLKPFRLGGIDKVMDLIKMLNTLDVKIVIGGMYEYGLSRYFTAMLAQYADYPSDITPEGYYYEVDMINQAGILKGGSIYFEPPVVNHKILNFIC
ncbi:o-succinylbenzoate synthase [Staphylococcus saprophyticus]|uniref:o-succinylbenzoate synthase n=3 Tax=Staphylococcus TaxID=1279 RepID=A0A380HMZ8_STASA|nr:o-succinylbenzoate synthase [Staphylococcus saprophyticus]MDW4259022.1 o-succinylbenzoate synthase [Staphylococcus saprophyticus]SUM82699.1 O-succinylbenzoic acid synthetase [Staphylococcus saprophyticus]SUM89531.1 O-succinylbenzoic acid synthetase [Staphylococcus saprophyticus]